jgi:hypothetical protein
MKTTNKHTSPPNSVHFQPRARGEMNAAISLREAVFRAARPQLKALFLNRPFAEWPGIIETLDATADASIIRCLRACVQLASAVTAIEKDCAGRCAMSAVRDCNITLAAYERSNIVATMLLTTTITAQLRPTADSFITHAPTKCHYTAETIAAKLDDWANETITDCVFSVDF